MAPVIRQLNVTGGLESLVCVTAQHRQKLDQVLQLFQTRPDIDLDIMRPNQTLAELTASIFTHLSPVIVDLQPDWILVQGDTTTVMSAAILAYYHRIKVGHVEAGLRTYNKWLPFPEELNRRIAGVAADLHFAPTDWARQNLLREGVPPGHVVTTGNPVIDALQMVAGLPQSAEVEMLLKRLGLDENTGYSPRLLLVTAHRRENFGKPLENICLALRSLAEEYGDTIRIIYPVHLNPNVQQIVHQLLNDIPNIHLLPPLDYLPFVQLL
jgi:UDP-N-acetylglucosamine 2-epimerase (non-hydrolysing)